MNRAGAQEAQEQHNVHQHTPPAPAAAAGDENHPVRQQIPDIDCLDQDGKRLRFNTDLVKGKVVVINFIFTSCTYTCPRLGQSFARLQTTLGDRTGKDVHLISISTDPVTDTPSRLKEWATRMHAKPGWTLVTGDKAEIDRLLKVMTGDPSGQATHSPLLLIGNESKGSWIEAYAFDNPVRLVQQIDEMVNAN
jgi:protein SCO1/2